MDQKTSQYLVWPPFASCSTTLLLHIVDQVVDCGMLYCYSSMAVRSFWILSGTGTRCRTRRSRASQTCSMVTCLVSKMQTHSFISCPGGSCRSRMWRSWTDLVTRGLRLWGRLDVLPNSLKRHCRRLMVEKLTLNYLSTALVDILLVSMPIARSLNTWDVYGILLWDKTVAFYCPQHKVHLCNDHAV